MPQTFAFQLSQYMSPANKAKRTEHTLYRTDSWVKNLTCQDQIYILMENMYQLKRLPKQKEEQSLPKEFTSKKGSITSTMDNTKGHL